MKEGNRVNYALVLAGGKGERMGYTNMPKPYLSLGEKPIVIHTIEQFLINKNIDKIVVCCAFDWVNYCKDLLKKYIPNNDNIYVTEGGKSRNETIYKGCKFIIEQFGLNDKDIVLTHDAVRPFISQRIIEDNLKKIQEYDAISTVISATDTIVCSEDGNKISKIPLRSEMYQAQTPQTFKLGKLISVFESLMEEEQKDLTDACKAFVINGEEVGLVMGEESNIKITKIFDLKIANAILKERITNGFNL